MISVGLTGNLGSGKSTVARLLAEKGAVTIDADAIVAELLSPGGAAVKTVLTAFPSAAGIGGGVDRGALADIVFGEAQARRELEAILHPLVIARTDELIAQARQAGVSVVVSEATLMFEAHRRGGPDPRARFDVLVTVTCDPAVQLDRALARSLAAGETDVDAASRRVRQRLAVQMDQTAKARLSDIVIDNSGSLDELRARVADLHAALVAR